MATTPDAAPRAVEVRAFIDDQPVSWLQYRLLLLCFIVIASDGFDTAIIGFIAPALRVEWAIGVADLGPLFAAGLFGLMLGAFAVGPAADRYGRRAMLVASMVVFGVASLASAFSGPASLITWRFVTGLGLGRAMPMTITLPRLLPGAAPVVTGHADVLRLHAWFGGGRPPSRRGPAHLWLAHPARWRRPRSPCSPRCWPC
ncbi:MAG: MFS transporter [Vicinamibacterales bacterium]